MSNTILERAVRILGDQSRVSSAELWDALEREGITLVSVPERSGGAGGTVGTAAMLLRIVGYRAALAPLAETQAAGWILSSAGLPVPSSPLTVAPVHRRERIEFRRSKDSGWLLYGYARRVPAARSASRLAIVGRTRGGDRLVASVPSGSPYKVLPNENLAGEARDDVMFDGVPVISRNVAPAPEGVDEDALLLWGALARSILMTGALERAFELSVHHATERRQFGRPIAKFQVIQHQLAIMAGEVAAASASAEAGIGALEINKNPSNAAFEIAAAKVRVGEAAGKVAAIAHQIHGAVGFTEGHPLHHSTQRLWAWRDEFGSESEWASSLGATIMHGGPETIWPTITGTA